MKLQNAPTWPWKSHRISCTFFWNYAPNYDQNAPLSIVLEPDWRISPTAESAQVGPYWCNLLFWSISHYTGHGRTIVALNLKLHNTAVEIPNWDSLQWDLITHSSCDPIIWSRPPPVGLALPPANGFSIFSSSISSVRAVLLSQIEWNWGIKQQNKRKVLKFVKNS